uniref:Aldehyde oxidase/xanthine dehydrogenase first molybdopterin binding domain-containing protein n=1 Tax=Arcella intermedia TaxID=1963864 RepID=A0A6B2LCE9_9EUKA
MDLRMYSNAGWSVDVSEEVMKSALYAVTNAYNVPNVSVQGYLCKTNITTSTAFRGFGKPQAVFICETWMDRIAKTLQMSPNEVRRKNLYLPGDVTFYQYKLEEHDATTSRCWDELILSSNYNDSWNQLRNGITIICTKKEELLVFLYFLESHLWLSLWKRQVLLCISIQMVVYWFLMVEWKWDKASILR